MMNEEMEEVKEKGFFERLFSKVTGLILSIMGAGLVVLVLMPDIYGDYGDFVIGIVGLVLLSSGLFKLFR